MALSVLEEAVAIVRERIRRPRAAVVLVALLAFGIGINLAIFTLTRSVLVDKPPYRDLDRLVRVGLAAPSLPGEVPTLFDVDFLAWRAASRLCEGMAAYESRDATIWAGGEPFRDAIAAVSPGLPAILSIQPILGRPFQPDEETSSARVALSSDAFWRRRLDGSRSPLGQTVAIDGEQYTIVGVLPPRLEFPTRDTALWIPLDVRVRRQGRSISSASRNVIARLKPGVPLDALRSEGTEILRAAGTGQVREGAIVRVVPLDRALAARHRPAAIALQTGVVAVLLIICANVGSLLLLRGLTQQRDLALRAALGASRRRLVYRTAVEAVLLTLVGGICSWPLSFWCASGFRAIAPPELAELPVGALDWTFAMATLVLSVATGIVCTVGPALAVARQDLVSALNGSTAAGSAIGGIRGFGRHAMLAVQTAVTVSLIAATVGLAQHLSGLVRVDPGFDTEHVMTVQLTLPLSTYPNAESQQRFFDRVLDALRTRPEFESVARVNQLPLVNEYARTRAGIAGDQRHPDEAIDVELRVISDGYFEALGLRMLRGRAFTDADSRLSEPVVVVNSALEHRYLPGGALGAMIRFNSQDWRILGVVADARDRALTHPPEPAIYCPVHRFSHFAAQLRPARTGLVLRSTAPIDTQIGALRRAVRAVDAGVPLYDVMTMKGRIEAFLAVPRFYTLLIGAFALTALLLAAFGVYSVVSYLAARRTREIGVRLALGADRVRIVRLLLRDGMAPVLTGAGGGVILTLWASTVLRRLLAGMPSLGVTAIVIAIGTACLAGLMGSAIPASRATRIDPVRALRAE